MTLLNFSNEGSKPQRSKKSFKLLFGIGTLVGVVALGSTLAASINLNSGAPVEFGQGVAQTTACDDQVKVTPASSFVNDEESGFLFTSITLSELDGTNQVDSADKGCADKSFLIKSYDADGNLLTPTFTITLDGEGNFSSPDGDTNGTNEGQTDSSVTLDFDAPSISAAAVNRITIESSAGASSADLCQPTTQGGSSEGTLLAAFDAVGPNNSDLSANILFTNGVATAWQNNVNGGCDISLSSHTLVGGNNGHIEIDDDPNNLIGTVGSGFDSLDRASIEMWVYFDPSNEEQNVSLISLSTTDNRGAIPFCGYTLGLRNGFLGINTCHGDTYGFDKSGIPAGWHHLVWIASSGNQDTQKIYLDGTSSSLSFSPNGESEENARPNIGSGAFRLPGWSSIGDTLKIGALNIYSGELSSSTISSRTNTYQSRLESSPDSNFIVQ